MPRRKRVDINKLNPFDAHDMDTINREWRRMQARKQRRANGRGWLRVVLVCITYLILGVAVLGCISIILTAMLAVFG